MQAMRGRHGDSAGVHDDDRHCVRSVRRRHVVRRHVECRMPKLRARAGDSFCVHGKLGCTVRAMRGERAPVV
jgi:hypothetical protein